MNAKAEIKHLVENGHFPTHHIRPSADDWFDDKFVMYRSEINGQFNTRCLNLHVTSPKTGKEVMFQKVRKVVDAEGELQAWVWKHFGTGAELHVIND